ncbi:MAG TPA: DUF5709 domain-containing protein [Candidatus Limnocylindrales bacterium]|nr:DUF5709 domain-containing protein [Candidatus Limnocylindrales bacterium]
MTIPNDPESEGIPDVADDDSTAYDDPEHHRFDDGPPYLPADESVAVDDYGVTSYESGHDEPLKARLVREENDFSPDQAETPPNPLIADEAVSDDMLAQAARDADTFGFEDDLEEEDLNEPPLGSVGRIVEPGEGGSFEDDEAESIAYDSGEREGLTAEEAAMHEVRGRDVPYE